MSVRAYEVLNAIPFLKDGVYLELGVGLPGPDTPGHHGYTFRRVDARVKLGVDIVDGPCVTQRMTTDAFFMEWQERAEDGASPPVPDVVYVDADHRAAGVLNDYNNAVNILADGGVIVLHDLVPPDHAHARDVSCGTGYRVLYSFLQEGIPAWVLDEDMGLTVIPEPRWLHPALVRDIAYDDFAAYIRPHVIPLDELLTRVRSLRRPAA